MSRESIERISNYYRDFGPMLKMGAADPQRADIYGMHIGYQDSSLEDNGPASKLMERKLIAEADIQDGQQVLDAGCGMGTLVFEIANLCPNSRVHGVDLLGEHVSAANKYRADFPNVSFSRQDYLNLALRDNSFDRILFSESLVHAQDKGRLFSEAYRILKPEGKIVVADVFVLGSLSEDDAMSLTHFNEATGIPGFENLDDIIRQLQEAGFRNILPQNITNNIVATINPEEHGANAASEPSQLTSVTKLQQGLAAVGELFGKGNAAYFILKADAQK